MRSQTLTPNRDTTPVPQGPNGKQLHHPLNGTSKTPLTTALCSSAPNESEAARQQYLGLEVVALLLVRATVHHVHDVVDGDGGLCDVGGQDNLPDARRRPLEDVLLVHHGDVGVHWEIKAESVLPG